MRPKFPDRCLYFYIGQKKQASVLESLSAQSATESANIMTLIYVILIAIVSCIIIQSVGDSLARGIGIMAAMAIIRFRTNFKDPRDTIFLFAGRKERRVLASC